VCCAHTLARRYVNFIAFTYAKRSYASLLGPALGPNSSGPLIGRTFREWHYGYTDPVLAVLTPHNASAPWWAPVQARSVRLRHPSEAPRWAVLAAQVGNGNAPPGAAGRFHSRVMATGRPGAHLDEAGNILSDNGVVAVAHAGGALPIAGGRVAGTWGFGDMSQTPFGLRDRQPVHWYMGRLDMSAETTAHAGLGRSLPFTWTGKGPYLHHYVPAFDYVLDEEVFTPCGGAGGANATEGARAAAARSCITGDSVYGVWNLSGATGAPLFLTRGHYYGTDPAMAASLGGGNGSSVFKPSREAHNLEMVLDSLFGAPLVVRASFQTNVGLRPTAVFFPRLYHGAPGPGGFTILPAFWTDVRTRLADNFTFAVYVAHQVTDSAPRHTAGFCHLGGAIIAGFGAFSLWSMRREEREAEALQQEQEEGGGLAAAAGSGRRARAGSAASCASSSSAWDTDAEVAAGAADVSCSRRGSGISY
jgi:hypothetical protein